MENEIAEITSLIGDTVRMNILWTLLDGKAYTASELAISANTSPQNISMHLNKLVRGDLLSVESQGRHKYFRFSRQEVAYAIEAIGNLLPGKKHSKIVNNEINDGIKYCRTCYDHLAGKVGVLITEGLVKQKIIQPDARNYLITKKGDKFFSDLEINTNELKESRRIFARPCLDWSERKYHLAGSLGAALLDKLISLDYFRRTRNSRAMVITGKGRAELYKRFNVSV